MKKLLLIPAMLLACMAFSQTSFILVPTCKQTLTMSPADTAYIGGMLTASDGFSTMTFTQLSGPSTAVLGLQNVGWTTGIQAIVQAPVTKLLPGLYTFTVTGRSVKGTIGTTIDSLIVQAPPAPIPPRTVVSSLWKLINGVWTPTFTFSDGTTQ